MKIGDKVIWVKGAVFISGVVVADPDEQMVQIETKKGYKLRVKKQNLRLVTHKR